MLVILPCKSWKCYLSTYQSRLCRCLPDRFSIRACSSLSTEAAPSLTNGLGADAELLHQSGTCTSENKMVQVYSVCQTHLHIKVFCSSISFIIQLWMPWGTQKQNSCWSETRIFSAPTTKHSDQKPYKKGLLSFHFFLLAITDTCVFFPCFPVFLTELWQGAGEGMTPRNRGQPAVWRRVRDVEMEPLRWQQEIPNAVRYFECSSALLRCLNSTQHLYPVLAFTFACIDCIMKLVSKVESSSGSLKELRLGFWKSLNGRLKSSLDFLNVHTQGSTWT